MITLERATEIGKRIVEDAGYRFDRVFLLDTDRAETAMYFARGIDENGDQAIEGFEIKKAILAEDGSVIDFVRPVPGC